MGRRPRTADDVRPTIRIVAAAAGVSPITVSRVLNRSPLVRPETAERVRAVIDELGFRLNHNARNLRSGRTVTVIGLVVSEIANPFVAALAQAVDIEAQRRGALLVVASCGDDLARERDVVTMLFDRGADGLLLYPTPGDHAYLADEFTEKRPIVMLGRRPAGIDTDWILGDNVGGAIRGVKHLLDNGHRRIGLIGYGHEGGHDDDSTVDPAVDHRRGRIEGYRRALVAAGIDYAEELVRADCDGADSADRATRELLALPDPPTALFTTNNRMTVGALRALGTGLGGVALVGFDDFELADVFDPPISVLAQDPAKIGRRAAKLVFERIDGSDKAFVRSTVAMQLVQRGSGELPPRRRSRR